VLPVVIIAVLVIPLLVIVFLARRRSVNAAEHPATETDAERRRTEEEFEAAERYEADWREERHEHPPDTLP
jgi:hypothetical protein